MRLAWVDRVQLRKAFFWCIITTPRTQPADKDDLAMPSPAAPDDSVPPPAMTETPPEAAAPPPTAAAAAVVPPAIKAAQLKKAAAFRDASMSRSVRKMLAIIRSRRTFTCSNDDAAMDVEEGESADARPPSPAAPAPDPPGRMARHGK